MPSYAAAARPTTSPRPALGERVLHLGRKIDVAAPADLDHVAELLRIGRLAQNGVVELFAALRRPLQQLHGAVDGDAFFVAGDEKRKRALRLAAALAKVIERRRKLAASGGRRRPSAVGSSSDDLRALLGRPVSAARVFEEAARRAPRDVEAQVAAAESQLAAAHARTASARAQLSDTTVRSPIDGVISNRAVNTGDGSMPWAWATFGHCASVRVTLHKVILEAA